MRQEIETRDTHYIKRHADETACHQDVPYSMDVRQQLMAQDFSGYIWMIDCKDCREIAQADFT